MATQRAGCKTENSEHDDASLSASLPFHSLRKHPSGNAVLHIRSQIQILLPGMERNEKGGQRLSFRFHASRLWISNLLRLQSLTSLSE